MADISAAYTGETIRHSDGIDYAVLDTTRLNFDAPDAVFGKKTKPTLIRAAKAGEEIVTSPGKVEESRTTAKGGELIFINKLPGGVEDAFIPRDATGAANGQQILDEKYELVGGDINGEGAYFRPKGTPSKLLHEAVTKPTVIKDAWGAGSHQFLGEGATLKQDKDRATGIDKAAFDETWSLTDKIGRIVNERTGQAAQR
jgi:hypothetical protein